MQLREKFRARNGYSENAQRYRRIQILLACINDSFEYYLAWSHSILLGLAGVLVFATIRYTNVSIIMYLMFPFCGIRCVLETIAQLNLTSFANSESSKVLYQWTQLVRPTTKSLKSYRKRKFKIDEKLNKNRSKFLELDFESKFLKMFLASCAHVKCRAGYLYTYTDAIVVCSLSNMLLITFNLLVLTK